MARVAIIGCGGTISAQGAGPLDVLDYVDARQFIDIHNLVSRIPQLSDIADVVPFQFDRVGSTAIGPTDWLRLNHVIHQILDQYPDISGAIITHGTSTLEETAYFLSLTLDTDIPVVLVGAQRPLTTVSSDAGMNLINAVRTAISQEARGKGVLVLMNDEIHAAREVTKSSTYRLHSFRTPDFGILGHADGDGVWFYRAPERTSNSRFDVRTLQSLPRVDVAYSYAGSEGTAIDAFVAAGAQGIVSAGFAPGLTTTAEQLALERAIGQGIVVVQSSRVFSGRVAPRAGLAKLGMIGADNLNPQKARVLLMLCLTKTTDRTIIQDFFARY